MRWREVEPVGPKIDVAPSRKVALLPGFVFVPPDRFQPAMVLAVRPGALGPSSAARASEKSPLEMPFR